ncbi:hypothetical protein KDA_68620 [Dictyobacter alpinus]|uniref:Pentapeptide repeat-containing protein n=1 Tax=Dictyobacter alpinus TaxID=2014873 RepID=A0A402BJ08_9CHLR|nr:pentapeptide repeat-containing protein [Dictyobacter alpinus]GCE31378.1 hypothetical protein KDA_68620 [Dictyobacter alpinus]
MRAKFYSLWTKMRGHFLFRARTLFIGGVGIAFIVIVVCGYWFNWDWAGLGAYNPPLHGSDVQRGKTLWDWLQLLIVPVVLALGGVWLNQLQQSRERQAAQQQATLERELTTDNQQETLLQVYIDKMAELLIEKNLRVSQPEDEVRNIARVRTLMVLSRLDNVRKGSVIRFLHEAGLIEGVKPIIRLQGADLSHIDLREADLHQANFRLANLKQALLSRADLRGAIMSRTDLQGANLHAAILQGTDLSAADLREADLSIADLQGAIVMGTDLRKATISSAQLARAKSAQAIILS